MVVKVRKKNKEHFGGGMQVLKREKGCANRTQEKKRKWKKQRN